MKPGSLCVVRRSSGFKVGYVVGPSRAAGKTRVAVFSANARSFSKPSAVADDALNPLPEVRERTPGQQRTINLAVVASAKRSGLSKET